MSRVGHCLGNEIVSVKGSTKAPAADNKWVGVGRNQPTGNVGRDDLWCGIASTNRGASARFRGDFVTSSASEESRRWQQENWSRMSYGSQDCRAQRRHADCLGIYAAFQHTWVRWRLQSCQVDSFASDVVSVGGGSSIDESLFSFKRLFKQDRAWSAAGVEF